MAHGVRHAERRTAPVTVVAMRQWNAAAFLLTCATAAAAAGSRNDSQASGQVTFTRDIAPLLFERCGACHHPDGPAPFSLLDYSAARQRATLIAAVTKKRLMPPWKSEPGYGEFVGQRHLTASEIGLIQQWAIDRAPEGDPRDLPPPPQWTAGWQLGNPDLVVSPPEAYTVRPEGADYSRTFVLPLPVNSMRYVKGFEFRAGHSGAIHHANIRIDRTAASRQLDELDPAPGYEGLLASSAVYPDGHFLGWTPGQVAPFLPTGLAWRLTPGTDLVVEIHFVPTGKPETVRPSVGLFFADEPPDRTPAMLRLGRQNIDIAPGEKTYVTTDAFVLPVDVEVTAVQPHAHYRAKEVVGTASLPDGTTRPLIYISDWDYRWQHVYRYITPLQLPKGTTLSMRYTYDNSSENPRNPHQPPRRVHWGQRSTDEMGDLWVQMLTRNAGDLQVLNDQIAPKERAEEIVGYEEMIRADPASVALHNDAALLYKDAGRMDKAIEHFEAVATLQPGSAAAYYNLATAMLTVRRPQDAIERFREALRLKPDYVLAHNNLGHALLDVRRPDEALGHFEEAARLDPSDADALYNVGMLRAARGSVAEAIDAFREAVRRQPDAVPALAGLAWALATLPAPPPGAAEEAIRLAEHAARLTGRRDAGVLSVLAGAQALAGEFDRAVATCDAALALRPDAPLVAAIRQRQAVYRQKRRVVLGQPPSR
jgi:tetratricopeptide (TPR) repeat protein/mono/diheme cytochrome c family protein